MKKQPDDKYFPNWVWYGLLLAVLYLMTGCATQERLVEVNVMVPVPCNEPMPERPAMPTEEMKVGLDVDVQGRYLRAEIDIREAYEIRLVTALENCRAPLRVTP
jgi:hypothetical protein